MGPYCKFCDNRCFVHFPNETPDYVLRAYGTSNIIATCPGGQKFEKEKVGYCYDDIQAIIKENEGMKIKSRLARRDEKAYVESGGTYCPFCGSDDIEGNSIEIESGEATQDISCLGCGARWCDCYTLTKIVALQEPDKERQK